MHCLAREPCPAQGLDRFQNLVSLSLASVSLVSLANFPPLPKLQKLLLSDNRISDLEPLAAAKLEQLQELDVCNNRVSSVASFKSLLGLKCLQILHVEANPITKTNTSLHQQLFSMLATLQYIDNEDRHGNGTPLLQSLNSHCNS